LSLFWSIALFLIVAAVLGFAIGWLLRGARLEKERLVAAPRHSADEAALADERDRLQTELRAARDAQAKLEASLADTQGLAETRAGRVHELEQAETGARRRIAALEQELSEARAAGVAGAANLEREPLPAAAPAPAPAPPPPAQPAGTPPQGLSAPEGEPDDLKKISGIGPGIEKTLNGLGIYHFRQIAAFTPDNVAWVNQHLRFKGRIEREDWIGQARKLAAGETT
jgi:predicted flap endonuclease-1-like 5' DNA nuclease